MTRIAEMPPIAAEKSETGAIVSRWLSSCGGERFEFNGIGGMRKLYFGSSGQDPETGAGAGYELMKVTDFALSGTLSPISRKQMGTEPPKAWDGRHNWTNFVYADASGSPSRIDYMDGGITSMTGAIPLPAPRFWIQAACTIPIRTGSSPGTRMDS
jgi:hypothetical protein